MLDGGADALVIEGLSSFMVSGDGARVLYGTGAGDWHVTATKPGNHADVVLGTRNITVRVDPRQEWREMFENAWRLDRDLFVQADMGGADWNKVRIDYEHYLPLLQSRYDLTYLLQQMQGELSSSHMTISAGDEGKAPAVDEARSIGADLVLDRPSGRYRLAHVYRGDTSRPEQASPLAAPGMEAPEGSFLLAINKTDLKFPDNPDQLIAETKGMLILSLATTPDGPRHDVRIEPLRNELAVRQADWVARNRALVDHLSGGKLGYVYLPDMLGGGVSAMAQDYTAQADKQGLVVDVRYNRGGFITPWVLQQFHDAPLGYFVNRQFGTEPRPATAMAGPKAVLVNQYSASDAEQFAFFFQQQGGTVVGLRTLGGIRGITSEWQLMDGGGITVPFNQIYTTSRRWIVENHGVDPDVLVDEEPAAMLAGQDPQLEAATRLLMTKLNFRTAGMPSPPAAPDLHDKDRS